MTSKLNGNGRPPPGGGSGFLPNGGTPGGSGVPEEIETAYVLREVYQETSEVLVQFEGQLKAWIANNLDTVSPSMLEGISMLLFVVRGMITAQKALMLECLPHVSVAPGRKQKLEVIGDFAELIRSVLVAARLVSDSLPDQQLPKRLKVNQEMFHEGFARMDRMMQHLRQAASEGLREAEGDKNAEPSP